MPRTSKVLEVYSGTPEHERYPRLMHWAWTQAHKNKKDPAKYERWIQRFMYYQSQVARIEHSKKKVDRYTGQLYLDLGIW